MRPIGPGGTGFQRDATSGRVRLTNLTDMLQLLKTGVAAAAGSQKVSQKVRFTASVWTGAAEAERDIDVYAGVITAQDESGAANSVARLALDMEGNRFLEIVPTGLGATSGVQMYVPSSVGGVVGYDMRVIANLGVTDVAMCVRANAPTTGLTGTTLFQVRGTGNVNALLAYMVNGTKVVGAQGAAVADATDAASVILRFNELAARMRAATGHGLIA